MENYMEDKLILVDVEDKQIGTMEKRRRIGLESCIAPFPFLL